jgi:glucose 1-dehydrogenase
VDRGEHTGVELSGRTALVTGAASGIGRAVALKLAAAGASVVLADLRRTPRDAAAGSLTTDENMTTDEMVRRAGGSAVFVPADLTRAPEVAQLFATAVTEGQRLDIVVSNAGIFGSSSIAETTEEEWDEYISVNLTSQFLVCRAAVRQMLRQAPRDGVRGRLITMSSQLAFTALPGHCAYTVSKAAVAHLTRQLAVDYGRRGIIVNAVAPGRIITGTHAGERDYLASGAADPAIAFSLSRTPFSRLGTPEDVANAVLFLASDQCTFVSGHNLLVDGGWTAY